MSTKDEAYLFYAPYSINAPHIATRAHELDADLRAPFNDLIAVVGVLRRGGVGVVLDVRRNELGHNTHQSIPKRGYTPLKNRRQRTWLETNTLSGPTSAKKPILLTELTMPST